MKVFKALLLISLISLSVSKILTPEEYEIERSKHSFETLDYEDYLEVAKVREEMKDSVMHYKDMAKQATDFISMYNVQASLYDPQQRSSIDEELEQIAQGRNLETIPYQFDWRDANRKCMFDIPIKHQKYCGSCFAFATTFALAKRFCLSGNSRYKQLDLSPQDLLECDTKHYKCKGGIIPYTWEFLEDTGVCTEECKPYYSGDTKQVGYCKLGCSSYRESYTKYRAIRYSMKHAIDETQIKYLIMKEGPMTTGMIAYDDLSFYKGGMYKHHKIEGEEEGGHAITLVGWGYDSSYGNYWIVANSWGSSWGHDGYFKIPFGECKIANMDGMGAMASFPELK